MYTETEIHQNNVVNMTEMAAMPIYGKNTLKIFFPGTTVLILIKLCMEHQRRKPFTFCSNYYPWLTLICFMARSNFATYTHIPLDDVSATLMAITEFL